jgi:hypothetical protein
MDPSTAQRLFMLLLKKNLPRLSLSAERHGLRFVSYNTLLSLGLKLKGEMRELTEGTVIADIET